MPRKSDEALERLERWLKPGRGAAWLDRNGRIPQAGLFWRVREEPRHVIRTGKTLSAAIHAALDWAKAKK